MILYHFTSDKYLTYILQYGIRRGDVPTSPFEGFNAPWLTNNPSWKSQGWSRGGLDKTAVRLTVHIQDRDTKLKYWPALAKELQVEDFWYKALDATGSNGSNNWFVYLGVIPVTSIEVEFRDNTSS